MLEAKTYIIRDIVLACLPAELPFTPVFCISASRVEPEDANLFRQGWTYVQGAGDDEDNWALVRARIHPERELDNTIGFLCTLIFRV